LTFTVKPSHISEDWLEGEDYSEHAERLSREKALVVARLNPAAIVLGGDTIVIRDASLLGKPSGATEAVAMLLSLSGRSHTVISGLAVAFPGGRILSGAMRTEVSFRRFDEGLARRYVETGEPMDKAGAYGIQGLGSALVQEIKGDYHTVMGLPLPLLMDLLQRGGWRYEFGDLVSTGGEKLLD
jgi:septum formation protein